MSKIETAQRALELKEHLAVVDALVADIEHRKLAGKHFSDFTMPFDTRILYDTLILNKNEICGQIDELLLEIAKRVRASYTAELVTLGYMNTDEDWV